jgi:RimJ/RimL family protein N-acetyltransferase
MKELPRVTLNTDRVVLRPLTDTDADDAAAACADPDLARFLPMIPVPYTRDDALHWIRTIAEAAWTAGGATFAIADPATSRLIGSVGLGASHLDGHATSIGYWVAPWARGRGVATSAARTLSHWAFSQGFGRIELTTDPANEASMRVALNSGFRHESIRRSGRPNRDGSWDDTVVWSRLASDSGDPPSRALPDLPDGHLTDGVVTLRRIGPLDIDELYELHSLPEVITTSVRSVPTRADTAARCARAPYLWLSGSRAEFAIRDAATDAFAGDLGLFHLDPTGQAMIGYSLRREYRGRGFTTRAARLVAGWAFRHAGIARLVAGTSPDNVASQRVLERAGFQREGYERGRLPGPDGGRIDNVAFALLPPSSEAG